MAQVAAAVARHGREAGGWTEGDRADKIDAVVALAMALDRVRTAPAPTSWADVKRPCLRCGARPTPPTGRSIDLADPVDATTAGFGRGCSRPTAPAAPRLWRRMCR